MSESDQFATSRAIDALPTPQAQAFADALVDRVTAIVGNHQIRIEEMLSRVAASQEDARGYAVASVSNQVLITEHLNRQDKKLEALGTGQTVLSAEFSAFGENVNQEIAGLHEGQARILERLDADERRLDRKRVELDAIKVELAAAIVEQAALKAELAARPSVEETRRLVALLYAVADRLGVTLDDDAAAA